MRLDIFLPFLRKPKKGTPIPNDGPCLRLAKRCLPAALFSDRSVGKAGLVRKWLKRLGPTWLSAPVRRVSQAVCFALFLLLFFYVCWPYSATPARVWRAVQPTVPDDANRIEVVATSGDLVGLHRGDVVHASRAADDFSTADGSSADQGAYIGALQVLEVDGMGALLSPTAAFAEETLEELRFAVGGPWTLYERHPDDWPSHYADALRAKEVLPAETLLVLDPLVAISTSLAAKAWVWSLVSAFGILFAAILIPRGFCGYICPLGTLIDLFDWAIAGRVIGKRKQSLRMVHDGWWVHIKYYLLAGTLLCSLFGVLVSGYVSAIPVLTRGMLFLFEPMQTAASRGWHNVPPMNAGHWLSIVLFLGVLSLGFLKPRFWCKYVCPSGAVFSVGNLFRISERKVESSCIHCNKCIQICPFDAIKPDFTTRTTDCTLCQTCAGVCPTQSIKFVERWNLVNIKTKDDPPTHETPLGRRGFLSLAAGTATAVLGAAGAAAATRLSSGSLGDGASPTIRPPGSVPEPQFLDLCIRCGECFKACPNNVLQPLGFEQGLEGLWTPAVRADWAGCESSCNACGQVCPTGAIRALPLAEKKAARMGLAIVNSETCLPHAGREACQLCVDDCTAAGYDAIEFVRVGTEVDDLGSPIEGTGFLAPSVRDDKCVGCGLCQARCYAVNVLDKRLLASSAIVIEAGPGKEDRLLSGSYVQLRQSEARARTQQQQQSQAVESYLPDFLE